MVQLSENGVFMLPSKNIYFDMDDTLTRTTDYVQEETKSILLARGDMDGLEEFDFLIKTEIPRFKYPEKFVEINKQLMESGKYMLEVRPTPLFNYFFLIPGNQPRETNFNILTHRGDTDEVRFKTRSWFNQYTLAATLGKIHAISHVTQPSKIEYLEQLHPDGDFILLDDNPLFDVTVIHPFHPSIRIYDEYSRYLAYKKQKRVVFKNGLFIL